MIGATIDFGPSIRAHARSRNREMSDEEVSHLAATLNSVAEIETSDQPVLSFSLGGDKRGDLHAALDIYGQGFGKPAGTEISRTMPAALTRGAQTATERAIELNRAAKAGSDETKRRQAETLVATWGNPWRSGNATHRAFITNCHPQLAARLRAEAGVRS